VTAPSHPSGAGGLSERAVVVVGASAGIGRALAAAATRRGARVVAAARRADRLHALSSRGADIIPVVTDVRDAEACRGLLARAAAEVGPVDVLCYCVGLAPLRMVADTSPEEWHAVLATNVVGANQVLRAALPHLTRSAVVLVLSSEAVQRPRPALGAYGASKAALEASVEAWRSEHPRLRFCCAAVGPTFPTEFGDGFDPELLGPALNAWAARGLAYEEMMATDDVARILLDTVSALVDTPGVSIDHLTLRSPSPLVGTGADVAAAAQRRIEEAPG
jgi:NAD(P)-dependent dehydrogenase (short-subunit alcohol dehydrogenase family)